MFSFFKSPTATVSPVPGSHGGGYFATLAGVLKFSGPLPTQAKGKEVSAVIVTFGDKLVRRASGHGFGQEPTGTCVHTLARYRPPTFSDTVR
ncbi:MAG TPA: hypothetical protein VN325_45825 [Steroidobacteraceae bacterium]|nr:hypothetical protein [Steroidobacteraceae bacterium]